jgi:hypothetical protein
MLGHAWLTTGIATSPRWESAPRRRWITSDVVGRVVTVALAILLVPALLAVFVVGGFAILLMAILPGLDRSTRENRQPWRD